VIFSQSLLNWNTNLWHFIQSIQNFSLSSFSAPVKKSRLLSCTLTFSLSICIFF
jgi:hypothetical protein